MEIEQYYGTLGFIFLFYLFTVYLMTRVILYNGLKKKKYIDSEDHISDRVPFLIAAGIALVIGTFILLDSITAFITSNLAPEFSWLTALGLSSIVFIVHATVLILGYSISRVIIQNALSIKNRVSLSVLWVIISCAIYLLLLKGYNYFINLHSYEIF